MVRKLAAMFLLAILPLAAQSQTLVQIPDQVANSGETVTVPVVVQDFSGVAVFEMYIDYTSSVLEYVSMTGPTPSPVVNDIGGRTIISWLSTNPLSLEDGATLMTLTFQVNGEPGESTALDFTNGSYLANVNSQVIPTIFEDGSIEVFNPQPPLAFNLVSPEDGTILTSNSTELAWNATTDPNPDDVPTYNVYFDTQADLSTKQLVSEAQSGTTFILTELSDNQTYYWTVFATDVNSDGTWASDTLSFSTSLPDQPSAFTLLSPEDGTLLESLTTWLTWNATSDPDDVERLQYYDVWLGTDADLTTAQLISDSLGGTEHFIAELGDDQTYFWTVRATDDNTAGRWASDTLSFSVAYPEAPLAFTLVSPENGTEITATSATLTWNAATDPDPGQVPTYDVWLDTLADLSTRQTVASGLTGTEFTVNDLLDDHTYYWAVHALDSNTPGTYSDTLSFVTNQPELPTEFSLLTPIDGDTVWAGLDTTLTWEASLDPDVGQVPFYDVWLDTLADLSTAELVADSIELTEFLVSDLLDDHQYFWTVRATDINSAGRWAADTLSFHTFLPERPTAFNLVAPEDNTVISFDPPFDVTLRWRQSFDPDPDQTVRYNVICLVSSNFAQDSTFIFEGIADTSYIVNLPDSLHIETWPDTINALWHVEAISMQDTVRSEETWLIIYAPPLDVQEVESGMPAEFGIQSTYPNPFNPAMTVVVGLPAAADLRVEAFNLLGQRVAMLHQGRVQAGYRNFTFDGSQLTSGVYFIRASVPGKLNQVQKVILMK